MPTLNWIGKEAVVDHHRRVPMRLLECDPALSFGDPEAENLLVEGDNLEALKALLPRYRGQVKCIYIDPPYNTGNEGWVYNDNVNDPRIKKWLGEVVGKEAEDLCRHDKWLCMMYPRLQLLWEFLRHDGVLWLSIDDNEAHNCRALLNDVFGPTAFLAAVVWKKRSSPDARATVGNVHDYLFCYVKNPAAPKEAIGKMTLSEERVAAYTNPDGDPRGGWASVDMTGMTGRATKEQYFSIKLPSGRVIKPPPGRSWGLAEATFIELRQDNRIWFGKNGDNVPRMKKFLSEANGQVIPSFWDLSDVGSNDEAKKEVNEILGVADQFDTPKPLRLLQRILEVSTQKDSLVMDSFAGSGTTGHAVDLLNRKDGGSRRCILLEMEPSIASNITRERLNRALAIPQEMRERERERERERQKARPIQASDTVTVASVRRFWMRTATSTAMFPSLI